jgi:hypothetical protein
VPAQFEQRRDLRVVPDAERVEEARHAADHDVASGRADWPAVPARRDYPGDDDGDLDGREAGIDDHQRRRHGSPPRPISHVATTPWAPW